MSSVWLCIPSKRPPEEAEKCLKLWRERGYKIALWRDMDDGHVACDLLQPGSLSRPYPGYAEAVNTLALAVLSLDSDCGWIVTGGDDVEPEASCSAEEIAEQCSQYFVTGQQIAYYGPQSVHANWQYPATFGVMQPTGDRWGDTPQSRRQFGEDRGAYADRVCGSPWIGREFALRINQGRGPLWPEYYHMYEDEELFEIASKLGVLWQRRDLIHLHNHWGRARGSAADMPDFLKHANSQEEWQKAKKLFDKRKAAGFPGSEPL